MRATLHLNRSETVFGTAAQLILVAGTALIISGLLAGCSNTACPEEEVDSYPPRTSPANVIAKLVETYEAMDAGGFVDCLSDTFEFWLNPDDLNDPGNPLPQFWNLADESTIAENMLGPGTDVERVQLTLTLLGNPVEVPTPGGGESSWQCVYSVDLWVYLPNDLILWANAAARFLVSADPDATSPSGGTLWEIVKWEDIYDPARSENSTWGGIKALYRQSRDGRSECTWGSIKAMFR